MSSILRTASAAAESSTRCPVVGGSGKAPKCSRGGVDESDTVASSGAINGSRPSGLSTARKTSASPTGSSTDAQQTPIVQAPGPINDIGRPSLGRSAIVLLRASRGYADMANLPKLVHGAVELLTFFQCHNCKERYTGKFAREHAYSHIRKSKHTVFLIEQTTTVLKEVQ